MDSLNTKSAFLTFVNSWRQHIPGGTTMSLDEAVSHCCKLWGKLTAEQRDYFKQSVNDANKLPSGNKQLEISISDQDHSRRELSIMKRTIKSIVMHGNKYHDLKNTKFVFCAFNYFVKDPVSGVCVPAEFSVCEFSLNMGVISLFSTLIDPGKLNKGLRSHAQNHSMNSHRLPLPPKALGERNMSKLYQKITGYLGGCQSTRPLIVFTATEMMPMVQSCFSFLSRAANKNDSFADLQGIRVFDIQYLFFVLKRAVLDTAELPDYKFNMYATYTFFCTDIFEFAKDIACDYHEKIERTSYCTQSQVIRWCYTFCDYMCGDLGITVKPGKQVPSMAKPFKQTRTISDSDSSLESFYSLQSFKELQIEEVNETGHQRSSAATKHKEFEEVGDYPSHGGRLRKGSDSDLPVNSRRFTWEPSDD